MTSDPGGTAGTGRYEPGWSRRCERPGCQAIDAGPAPGTPGRSVSGIRAGAVRRIRAMDPPLNSAAIRTVAAVTAAA